MGKGTLGDLFSIFPDLPGARQPGLANVRRLRRPPRRDEPRDDAFDSDATPSPPRENVDEP
jgi:hypothetical protein